MCLDGTLAWGNSTLVENDGASVPNIALRADTQHSQPIWSRHHVDLSQTREDGATEHDGCIALIESRSFIRECMQRCLQSAFSLPVVTFATASELEHQDRDVSARLIILSLLDSHQESAKACKLLSELLPTAPIIVFGGSNDPDLARIVITCGAKGYIPWTMGFEIAVSATRIVLAGGRYVPVDIFLGEAPSRAVSAEGSRETSARIGCEPRLIQDLQQGAPVNLTRSHSDLCQSAVRARSAQDTSVYPVSGAITKRELSVIQAIQLGKSNKIIAYHLNLCESTVKVHVRNIMRKLGAKNRTDVAIKAQSMLNTIKATVSAELGVEAA